MFSAFDYQVGRWLTLRIAVVFILMSSLLTLPPVTGRVFDELPNIPLLTTVVPAAVVAITVQPAPDDPANIVTSTATAPTCFYADSDLCEAHRTDGGCNECMKHPTVPNSLVCCNVTDIEKAISCVPNPTTDNSSYWVNVHIRNATLDELDFSQKYWKRLDSLVVTDGHINRIVKEFTKFSSPHCINISNNALKLIQPRAFKDLVRLQVLDLSHNNLSTMPNLNSIQTNLSLDIR